MSKRQTHAEKIEAAMTPAMLADREARQADRASKRDHRVAREVGRVKERKSWRKREAKERRIAFEIAERERLAALHGEEQRLQPMVDAMVAAALAKREEELKA